MQGNSRYRVTGRCVIMSCLAIYTQGHPEVCQGVLRIYSPRERQMTATDQRQQYWRVTPRWYAVAREEPQYEKRPAMGPSPTAQA